MNLWKIKGSQITCMTDDIFDATTAEWIDKAESLASSVGGTVSEGKRLKQVGAFCARIDGLAPITSTAGEIP